MKFGVITHTEHKFKGKDILAYEPYVREMNLWGKYVSEIKILAPISKLNSISKTETSYSHSKINIEIIPNFNITNLNNIILSILVIPKICFKIFKVMRLVDHIHLRCPGNIGLLGSIVQILFPSKPKTVKYAGNWDPKSKQPLSYRFQKWIVSNTFLTKNCKVLVYGEWANQSENIVPFFTASYLKEEIEVIKKKDLKKQIKCVFVGNFTKGKQPLLSIKVVELLKSKGWDIVLNLFGNGSEYDNCQNYISKHNLSEFIFLEGNQSKETVKKAFQKSHFLLFFSKSEGWPKVVAEAMFWGCIPISTKVSCVPQMLDNGNRGSLINASLKNIVYEIKQYINKDKDFIKIANNAQNWSQNYTLDYFSSEISKILKNERD